MKPSLTQLILAGALAASLVSGARADDIPARPEQITFAPLKFEPPKAADYRGTLSNGVVVYMAPSGEFPLINLSMAFRGGSFLDPAGKTGLASATGAMMRRGGAGDKSAADTDEQFDFLAADAGSACGDVTSGASLNCLKSNFDEAFGLFMDMVRRPRFQQDRLDVFKGEAVEAMKQRNDDAGPILSREWDALLYGADHFEARQSTKKSIDSITVDDLKAMHARIFHPGPGNLYIAVTGDFDPAAMKAKLEKAFEGWQPGETVPEVPAPAATFKPGVYHVEKDIPQGKVNIGMRAIKRDDPDAVAVQVMNNILGGGGFTSRITNRVRSDEGLAYSAGSSVMPKVYYPGEFDAFFQSKNATCALAVKLVMEEIERIRTEPVKPEELEIAKNAFIETFPRKFESKPAMLAVFIDDEMTGRPKDFWQTFRDKVKAVGAADVQRVAQKYLQPKDMAIMVVGKWDEIAAGDEGHRASMAEFFGGQVTHLPLRDPLTLEPVKAN